jgi:imidazolonepropionase-like amidohydrolase
VLKVMTTGGMITVGTDVFATQFSEAELATVVAAGHQAGLKVLAHAHALPGVWHAIRAGVDGLEHFSCLTETGPEVSEELLEAVAAAGITIDLTLGFDLSQMPSPDLMPPGIRAVMERTGMDFSSMHDKRVEVAGRIRAHGIRLVTGTDAGAAPPKRHGGTALAVQTLVEAGYPVAEAAATATSVASQHVGLAGVTGALRAGLAADLLVVDGDLATDPGALDRPIAVLVRGATVLG